MHLTQSKKLDPVGSLVHGFANRKIGVNSSEIEKQFNLSRIAQLKQVHSGDVIIVDNINAHNDLTEGDALVTNLKGVGIGVRTADCVPILITDHDNSVVAAVHAGWRGTYSEIALNTVKVIESQFGISPSKISAVIGPSIKNCCYEVGYDVASLFEDRFENTNQYLTETSNNKYLLDLSIANKLLLENSGVTDIEVVNICTKCDNSFYSYRREGKGVSTQLSFIAIK